MEGILVNISDHPTLPLKRKQEVFCFKPDWRGEGQIEVFLKLHHYIKNEDGSYGEEFESPSINNYESKMIASDTRKVDPTDGMECYEEIITINTPTEFIIQVPREEEQEQQILLPEEEWVEGEPTYTTELAVVIVYDQVVEIRNVVTYQTLYKRLSNNVIVANPIGQFQFFNNLIRNYPVHVGQMLSNFVMVDDQIKGKWNK